MSITIDRLDGNNVRDIAVLVDEALREQAVYVDGFPYEVNADKTLGEAIHLPRKYWADSPVGIASLVSDLADKSVTGDQSGGEVRVGVHDGGVHVLIDERTNRLDRVKMDMPYTDGFLSLTTSKLGKINQPDLVWLLRSEFPNAVAPDSFMPAIKSLKSNRTGNTQSVAGHDRESISVDEIAEIQGEGTTIPEEITLSTPVYECLAGLASPPSFTVKCSVRVNPQTMMFTIKPNAGEIARATVSAVEFVADWIKREIQGDPENVKVMAHTRLL